MLYTLFSPSEGKLSGGILKPEPSMIFGQSFRHPILLEYNTIINSNDTDAIQKLFGIKKESEIEQYVTDIFHAPVMSAIERYDGVAYDYLDFRSLDEAAQAYIKTSTLIFSNLYGVILAGDDIANYKVKQGNKVGQIAPERFYADLLKEKLDTFLNEHEILDLRAGYYDKFYKSPYPYTTLKFIKQGKVVSHWAKAYRGIVLRELAMNQIRTLDDFERMEIKGLHVKEIKQTKLKREIVYDIVD